MDIFAQNILDHFKNPRNKETLENPTVSHGEANYSCGDKAEVFVIINDEILEKITFDGSGCSISQATLSMLTEEFVGKNVKEILNWGREEVLEILGISVSMRREKCALLGLLAIQNAIRKHLDKPPKRFVDLMEG